MSAHNLECHNCAVCEQLSKDYQYTVKLNADLEAENARLESENARLRDLHQQFLRFDADAQVWVSRCGAVVSQGATEQEAVDAIHSAVILMDEAHIAINQRLGSEVAALKVEVASDLVMRTKDLLLCDSCDCLVERAALAEIERLKK